MDLSLLRRVHKFLLCRYHKKPSRAALRKAALKEFEASRALWLESVTRESLLQDLTLEVTVDGPEDCAKFHACFRPPELEFIRGVFEAKAENDGSRKFFIENTIFAIFADHLSPTLHAHLSGCKDIISRSIIYFASYPFHPGESGVKIMDWNAFIRALTFLTCRDIRVFICSFNSSYTRDGIEVHETFGRQRTARLRVKDLFRSISLPITSGHHTRENRDTPTMYKRDVLDVLYQVQPKFRFETHPLSNEALKPVADGLTPGRCPLECYFVPKDEILRLINFLAAVLDDITTTNGREPSVLEGRLRTVAITIGTIPRDKLSFADLQVTRIALDIFLPNVDIRNKLPFETSYD